MTAEVYDMWLYRKPEERMEVTRRIDMQNPEQFKIAEGPIDFAAIEAEICGALWFNDAGTVGLNPFMSPEKDPA